MKKATFFLGTLLLLSIAAWSQNFSNLLNKKLNKLDDISSAIESGLGSLLGGGKLKGDIDSVVVVNDSELELQVKIFYRGFENGYLKIGTTGASKQKQNEIKPTESTLAGKSSPLVFSMKLKPDFPKGQLLESPYLKLEISKEASKPGQVVTYSLNKKWKVDLEPENVVINIKPHPVGNTARLKENEVKDVNASKAIIFDATKLYYNPKLDVKTQQSMKKMETPVRSGIQSYDVSMLTMLRKAGWFSDNISGTWLNTDANTGGITKLIVTNNKEIQVFGKCSPTDCDWGKTGLTDYNNNTFSAGYKFSFKSTSLTLTYNNKTITLVMRDAYRDARGLRTSSYTFSKSVATMSANTRLLTIKEWSVNNPPPSNPAPADLTPKGPANSPIPLWSGLTSDNVDIQKPQDISNINMNIFPDKNPASGTFYYLPADYHLKYETKDEPEKGYSLTIDYGRVNTSDTAPVRMSAKLTAGMTMNEIGFIEKLLKASIPAAKELRPLPLGENPVFSFQSYLTSQYNIPQDKIIVQSSTDLTNDIHVAWQTDADTKEFIQVALTSGEGIAATVILKPQASDIIQQQIPVTINLADSRTLGKITLDPATWRTKKWKNSMPYPLQLKHLNILKISSVDKTPVIYSWSLDNTVVPSRAQVSFDASLVPAWLDVQESVLMWIDYSVVDCRQCNDNVITAVTRGVSNSTAQMIRFNIPPAVFDTLRASYFTVSVRSKQVDPNNELVKELPSALRITKSADKEFAAGPLYVPTNGTLAFEYKLRLVTADGEFVESNEWIPATEKEIFLGKSRMKEIFKTVNQ